jgi:hypothetical protein
VTLIWVSAGAAIDYRSLPRRGFSEGGRTMPPGLVALRVCSTTRWSAERRRRGRDPSSSRTKRPSRSCRRRAAAGPAVDQHEVRGALPVLQAGRSHAA